MKRFIALFSLLFLFVAVPVQANAPQVESTNYIIDLKVDEAYAATELLSKLGVTTITVEEFVNNKKVDWNQFFSTLFSTLELENKEQFEMFAEVHNTWMNEIVLAGQDVDHNGKNLAVTISKLSFTIGNAIVATQPEGDFGFECVVIEATFGKHNVLIDPLVVIVRA